MTKWRIVLGSAGALVVAAAIALGVVVAGSSGPPRVPVIVQPAANQQAPAAPATTAAPTTVAQTTTTAATTTTVAPTTTTAATTTTVAQTTTTAATPKFVYVTMPPNMAPNPNCAQTQTCPTVTLPVGASTTTSTTLGH